MERPGLGKLNRAGSRIEDRSRAAGLLVVNAETALAELQRVGTGIAIAAEGDAPGVGKQAAGLQRDRRGVRHTRCRPSDDLRTRSRHWRRRTAARRAGAGRQPGRSENSDYCEDLSHVVTFQVNVAVACTVVTASVPVTWTV